jgi:hypothetical protein
MSARATELIVNGGFESGSTGWTLSGGVSASASGGFAHSGTYFLYLGGAVNENDAAYQTITIPANATAATLSFYYNINSLEGNTVAYDTFSATIRNTSGTILATVINLSNINQTSPGNPYYYQQTYNLLPYAGQTIRIYFTSINDSAKVTNFRVDDVSVQVTVATVSAPTVSTSPADQITTTSARMNGTVNPNGADTTVYFQYGLTTAYGNNTGTADAGSGTAAVSVQGSLTGLTPNTTYHYQLVAYNSAGTRYGGDVQFTTLTVSCSYSLSPTSASPSSSAGSSSFTVTTGSSCTWSAVSDSTSWLHTSSSGTGSGAVSYSYDANGGTSSRTGHITVGGQTFTVTQAFAPPNDGASLVSQTIPLNTVMAPGQTFTMTWTMQNTGTTTWSPGATGYTLNLVGTDSLGAVPLSANTFATWFHPCATIGSGSSVAPGATATFSMYFIAPETAGTYYDNFQMVSASSVSFGPQVTVQIVVQQAGPTGQYDRAKAVSYANNYAGFVCSDGWFWTDGSTDSLLGALTPVPTSPIGDDCAHFVSCCIGSQSNQKGGGLNIPSRVSRVPPTYGEPSAPDLVITSLLGSGLATEVSSLSSLSPGDVIAWSWSTSTSLADIDHVTLYLGNGLLAAHSASRLDVSANTWYQDAEPNWEWHLIHIFDAADTTAPTITITSPTSNPTYLTSSSTVSLGGTASDNVGVTQVTWSNDRGGSGTASGTTAWTISNIALQSGANVITVTARDAAGNTGPDTITVTYTDTTAPAITITSPTSNPTYSTSSSTVSLGGTASDNVGVTQVTWSNDRGGSGTASGTTAWTISNIALQSGANVITVTAHDAAGNTGPDTITVTYTPTDTTPPTASAFSVTPTSVTVGGAVTISFTVSDSGGSGLSSIWLYRAPDAGGTPGTWGSVGSPISLSGNGPASNSFSNSPAAGKWWYGFIVYDGNGNWNNEQNEETGGVPDFQPIQVTVATAPVLQQQLTGMSISNHVFRFVLNGPVGSNYVVKVSTNLVNWSPLSTNTIPAGGWVIITDSATTNMPRRFYRAVAP